MEQEKDNSLKTFNTAKKFVEEALFPIQLDFKKYQRQANFGHESLDSSTEISEEVRDIFRFNGLKAMVETVHDLLYSISSTVKLKGNKSENEKLNELIKLSDQIKLIFYEHKERFFNVVYKDSRTIEIIDRNYFEKIKDIIDVIYVNAEILMTRNKLLFADSKDEFMDDEEIMEKIRKEYTDA